MSGMRIMKQEVGITKERRDMNIQSIKYKGSYVAPRVELLRLQEPLHLLVSVSGGGRY